MIVKYTGYKSNDYDEDLLLSVQSKSGSTYKGASSGAPALPKISSLERASTIGNPSVYTPKQTTLPKRTVTVGPKQWSRETATNNLTTKAPTVSTPSKFTSALEKASVASDLTPTTREMNRSNNVLKSIGATFASSIPTLGGAAYQSITDWQDKIREQGLRSSLTEMAQNMDNPNWTYGKPYTSNIVGRTGYNLSQKANDYLTKAQEGLTPAQKQALGLGTSIAQTAVTLPTAVLSPSAPLIIMGANAAASKANELTSQGKTATEALGRAGLSAAIEVMTEKIPLERIINIAKIGGKPALKNILTGYGIEGSEELLSYIMNYAADVSAGDETANFSLGDALLTFGMGGAAGAITSGAATAIGRMRLADDGYSQEYIDPEVARQIRSLDHLLSGYDNITQGGRTDIINIRDYGNGVYQVEYGTPREEFINDPTVFYQGRMAVETMPRAAEQQNGLTDNNVLSRPVEMSNVSANNTDTYSNENINIPQPKELGEKEVLPAAEETERSADSLGIVNPEVQQLFEDINQMRENSRSVYQSAISGTAPFERMAKADTRENARNISALVNKYGQKGGITDTILTKGMFDINGNKIDNRSFVEVASQVPNEYKQLFNEYWDELHNIDRQAQGKPVTKHTADESRQRAAEIESQHPEFKKYKDDISDYLDKFMRAWGVDAGLISEEAYLAMKNMYPNYVPTYKVDGGGTGSGYVRSGKKLRGNTGIGRAKGSTAEVMSFDEAIAKKINTMIAAATKNDISREIFSFAQDLPAEAARSGIMIDTDTSGQYGGQMDLDEYIDSVDKNIARQISKGNYEITFYNNGKPQTMKISRDVWEAFNFLDNRLGGVKAFEIFAKVGRTLTSPMRGLTTTYNPLFFMTNLIRDMQTYVINNTASNSAVALKNYVRAIKGIATNADTFEQYKALGGSQNGYYGSNIYSQAYERVNPSTRSAGQKLADRIKTLPRAIEAVGEFTEKIPRYAEFLNTIDRLGNTDAGRLQASLNAADVTVNFNRSSPLSTMANAWVPYFNAGLQGVDKTLRQIKAHPVKTGTRAAVSVFLPTLLLYLVNKDNPHWEDVKDGVRDSYYLIPNVFGPHDADGNAETFIRLPKSREFGALFSASFERFIRAFEESEDKGKSLSETLPTAFEGYGNTLANSFLPPNILGDNIAGSFLRLGTNTAWHGGKIVPSNLEKVSPEFQYDINTSDLAMEIAEKAQKIPGAPDWLKSPMKVDYLIDSYGGYGADLIQGLTSRKNQGATKGETLANSVYTGVIQPFINRFTTDSAYSNYNLDRFYDELDVLETAANDRNLRENLPSDYRTPEEKVESDFTKARNDISDITKQERAVLESAMPIREKNAQIRALKQQKNAIAKEMLQNEDTLYSQYEDSYIPVISGLKPERQEAARELNRDYGLTYDEFADLYEKYSEIDDEDIKPNMKQTRFDEYLYSLGYTDEYAITPVLKDEFSYFNVSPAKSYYDSKGYQLVDGVLPVDTYADLSGLVNGLESGVDYPKGEFSPFAKSLIDAYLEKYGYNPTANERAKIYDAMGVAKSYWY